MSGAQQASNSLDGWINQQRKIHDVPGLVIAVCGKHGAVTKTYGVRDLESGQKIKDDVLINIDSQAKTFTAVAILQLVQQGKLKLDDKLTDLLPTFKSLLNRPELRDVTLRDALSHQTRLMSTAFRSDAPDHPTKADLEKFPVSNAMFSDCNQYSNAMYMLLGVVIENVSKEPYRDYVKKRIIEKHNLGEIYTQLADVPEKERGRIPVGYLNGQPVPVAEKFEALSAAGGFYAAPQALSGFFHKLAKHEIVPKEFVDQMFSPLNPHVLQGRVYGLGALSYPSETGNMWGHTGAGSFDGRRSATLHSPELNMTVSVLQTRSEHENDLNKSLAGDKEFSCAAIIQKILAAMQAAEPSPSNQREPSPVDHAPSPSRSARHPAAGRVSEAGKLKQ